MENSIIGGGSARTIIHYPHQIFFGYKWPKNSNLLCEQGLCLKHVIFVLNFYAIKGLKGKNSEK